MFRSKEKSDGATNVRTLILGSIFWILFHVWANSQNMKGYFVKDYFWWFFLVDVFAMGIIYKLYYKRSIFNELKGTDTDIYIENEHRYIKPDQLNGQDIQPPLVNNILDELLSVPNPKPSISEYLVLESENSLNKQNE